MQKKSDRKYLCWKFARCTHLSAALYVVTWSKCNWGCKLSLKKSILWVFFGCTDFRCVYLNVLQHLLIFLNCWNPWSVSLLSFQYFSYIETPRNKLSIICITPNSRWRRKWTLQGVRPATFLGLLETFRLNWGRLQDNSLKKMEKIILKKPNLTAILT